MDRLRSNAEPEETALLVGVQQRGARDWEVTDSVDELSHLCRTAGARVADKLICRLARPNPATYVGKGKAEEIAGRVREQSIATVVFDDELTPAQGRNLERIAETKVIDRTQVILDIFAQRARTREGQMQIELAQLEYLLPRLRRMWTHLERQKGGIGMHGPGEKQLEMDRRRIEERIDKFKEDLEQVRSRRAEQRKGRRRHGWALVSLVGYTNAGKSTLLNALTGSDVLADDKLFATLDPTTRQFKLPNHQLALLTDTVGFIRKLPHDLVESFKATLEEVTQADLLLHVIDASHPLVDRQIEAVRTVLSELGVADKPMLNVLNKIDLPAAATRLRALERELPGSVAVSALTGQGFDALRDVLADGLRSRHESVRLRLPLSEGRLIAQLRSFGHVHSETYEEDSVVFEASIPIRFKGAYAPFRMEEGRREKT
jgi:GTPase